MPGINHLANYNKQQSKKLLLKSSLHLIGRNS